MKKGPAPAFVAALMGVIATAGLLPAVMGLLFFTPLARRPLVEGLPGISAACCPRGSRLEVEYYSSSSLRSAKNRYRLVCLDSTGRKAADVSNRAGPVILGWTALGVYLLACPVLYAWVLRSWRPEAARK